MRSVIPFIIVILLAGCRKEEFSQIQTSVASEAVTSTFVTAENFRYSKFRGFNLSVVQTYDELKAKNIPAARATGANIGRIWVRVRHDSYNRYYFDKPTARKTIDSAVKIAQKVGMHLVLTVEFMPRQGQDDWWGNTTRKANIAKFWRDSLALRYRNSTAIAAYDLMNEPRRNENLVGGRTKTSTDAEYMQFQSNIVNAIRSVDANHVIAIEVLENQMLGRVAPLAQRNLIYSPHGYSKPSITHQGVTETARKYYPQLSGECVVNYFKNVTYWSYPALFQKKYNAVIWVGEFSCINWAPKNTYGEWTSTRWVEDAVKYMESLGWSWSYHAWREYQGWDAEIPSSWYVGKTYYNAKPTVIPTSSARSATAPTVSMLRRYFGRNY